MKCFNHASADGVGLCKNCQKALCHDCLVISENGLACKSACEEKVRLLDVFYNQNIYNRYNHLFISRLVLGLFFVAISAYNYYAFGEIWLALIFAGMGLITLVFAFLTRSKGSP